MGSDALVAAIEADGRERAAAILRQAEAEVRALQDQASAELRSSHRRALAPRERELRAESHARLAAARAEVRRRVLEARSRLLERIFEQAHAALEAALAADAAQATLAARARTAVAQAPPGPLRIRCSPGAVRAVRDAVGGEERVAVERDPELPPGFQLDAADGALVVDATLERLLETERPRLAIELVRRIEGGAA